MQYPQQADLQVQNIYQQLPVGFRSFIEDKFYAKVADKARLEYIKNDSAFLKDPVKHIALYSDHGVVHVRDVAQKVIRVIDQVNGVLIPERHNSDLRFLKGYALHIAYLHDIGMVDFSDFGRFMHPEFAAQYVFKKEFDPFVELIWKENAGNIPWRLMNLFGTDNHTLKVRLRELLSLSVGHSKSKTPIALLNNPEALQEHMKRIISTSTEQLYLEQKIEKLEQEIASETLKEKKRAKKQEKAEEYRQALLDQPYRPSALPLNQLYQSFQEEAYSWLTAPSTAVRRLMVDVMDTLRCLRAADALRQRGTVLRTSAGYEIFVDQNTANAIYALRSKSDDELYLLEGKKPLNAGEANIASSEFDKHGNLRISMHRGNFKNRKIVKKAAYNVAFTIDDIQADTIESFLRNPDLDRDILPLPGKPYEKIEILIEGVDDNPDFAEWVEEALKTLNPSIKGRIATRASLQGADLSEVERYLSGKDFYDVFPESEAAEKLLLQVCKSGIPVEQIRAEKAFKEVKVVRGGIGELLIKSGSNSGFVYVPFESGLKVYPLGGYASRPAPAWVPIGNTGVIRGATRNANVYVEKDLQLLMIPKQIYLRHWYTPLSSKALGKIWEKGKS